MGERHDRRLRLAATLYYLLTGQTPVETSQRLLGKVLPTAAELAPKVSLSAAAVMAGLALEEGQRPQQVRPWLDLLTPLSTASVTPMPTQPASSRAPTVQRRAGIPLLIIVLLIGAWLGQSE